MIRAKNQKPIEVRDTAIRGEEHKWVFSASWGPSGGKYLACKEGALRLGLGKLGITIILGMEFDEFILGYTKYRTAQEFAKKLFPEATLKKMAETTDGQAIGVPYILKKDK